MHVALMHVSLSAEHGWGAQDRGGVEPRHLDAGGHHPRHGGQAGRQLCQALRQLTPGQVSSSLHQQASQSLAHHYCPIMLSCSMALSRLWCARPNQGCVAVHNTAMSVCMLLAELVW